MEVYDTGETAKSSDPVPQSRGTERDVLGAAMASKDCALLVAAETELADFWDLKHRPIWDAVVALVGAGEMVVPRTVATLLHPGGGLAEHEAIVVLGEMTVPTPLFLIEERIRRLKQLRFARDRLSLHRLGLVAAQQCDLAALAEVDAAYQRQLATDPQGQRDHYVPGGSFILDAPTTVPALWGRGDHVLWSQGEPFMICGPEGVGKTTLAQRLVLARLGIEETVLGYPVAPGAGRVLYIAADRPAQAARSFRRMVGPEHRELLDELLVIWKGPLPHDLVKRPEQLVQMAQAREADTVVVDSLKDVAAKLSDDETGSLVNRAFQFVVAEGIDPLVLHHQRKEQAGAKKPMALADVYGSRWITSGCGSVVLLWGEPGDPIVELAHLKQPSTEVGPLKVLHDQATGRCEVVGEKDVYNLLAVAGGGLTVHDFAVGLFGKVPPVRNDVEKARRQADALVRAGRAKKDPGSRGGAEKNPDRYYLTVAEEGAS